MGRPTARLCRCLFVAAGALSNAFLGCTAARAPERVPAPPAGRASEQVEEDSFDFPDATLSPRQASKVAPELAPFLAACRSGDAALSRAAERFAARRLDGRGPLDGSELSFTLRAEGSPYVWPRAWTLEGTNLTSGEAVLRMKAWLATFGDGGQRRCGVALAGHAARQVLAVVAVDALADLDAMPMRRPSGSWVDVNARLLVPATSAKLLVLAPAGAPYAVPTTFDGAQARARFRVDRPGAFAVQLLADVSGGLRPVLEAQVYADAAPPRAYAGAAAPGEPPVPLPSKTDGREALLAMINGARQQEGVPALSRDPSLDAIAAQHAAAMRAQRRLAHDVGDGDPQTRADAAGLGATVGENVAHASDVAHAHRVLWASPSHRGNLVGSRFDRVGIGLAPDADGSVWVCELFADFDEGALAPD